MYKDNLWHGLAKREKNTTMGNTTSENEQDGSYIVDEYHHAASAQQTLHVKEETPVAEHDTAVKKTAAVHPPHIVKLPTPPHGA